MKQAIDYCGINGRVFTQYADRIHEIEIALGQRSGKDVAGNELETRIIHWIKTGPLRRRAPRKQES